MSIKQRVTTYFRPEALKEIDNYCKKANVSRANFLEIASKHYINSVETKSNLLSYAYHAYTRENWSKNAVDDFLANIWDIYSHDEDTILKEVFDELEIECTEYQSMVDIHGFEKICSILIKCMEKEVNSRAVRYFLK